MGRSAHRRTPQGMAPAAVPAAFGEHLRDLLGEEAVQLELALATASPVSIRTNPLKWQGPGTSPVPWCTTGHYLDERPAFTFDPLLHAGCYYVQEGSSMLLEQAVMASGVLKKDIVALDLCAAPGGKSTHLRSLLTPGSLLVANEIDRKRQAILLENLWKWGAPNTVITGSAPKDLITLPEFFDLIVLDAPCSGEGMFRKDPFARQQWSPKLVQQCVATQESILESAWKSLRPGGSLIYSTCTWEEAENEEHIAHLLELGGECIPIPVDPIWGVVVSGSLGTNSLRCYPHRVRGEGFFIALVRKPEALEDRPTKGVILRSSSEADETLRWLKGGENYDLVDHDQQFFAVARQWGTSVQRISSALRILSPGIPLAERKGNDLRPHEALALTSDLQRSSFPNLSLDRDEAIAYLRGSALPANQAHGPALATYNGVALGWLHGAVNRWNNRWPASWRIRSQHPSAPHVSW